jgi:UDPglucose 6-dehydrogenase
MGKKIGVIGLWHLGCVISVSWTKVGLEVFGFDYDSERVKKLNDGIPPLFEPNLKEAIKEGFDKNIISFSDDINTLKDCDFIFLSYDTPVLEDDTCDTSILENSVKDVREVMKDGAILIISSQSPVGYCVSLRGLLLEKNKNLDIAYSPENLRLGEAIDCYLNPGRIILGTASVETEQKCLELFGKITDQVLCMSLESAETVKHGINSFLALSIVFANNLADICEEKNARIDDVVRGLKSDPRIGTKAYLSAGIGFSGGTLGRDLKVLEKINIDSDGFAELFGFIHKSNNERKISIVNKLKRIIGDLSGKTVGVLGLTYKPGTSTLRRSLPLEIVDQLLLEKVNVLVFDPKADYSELSYTPKFTIASRLTDLISKSRILLILTEWPEFKNYDWEKNISSNNNHIIFDAKNCLDEKKMKELGYVYHSIGRA